MLQRTRTRPRGRARSLLVALATAAAVGLVAAPASAEPSDQPGGTSGVLDSEALDELQQRAAEVQEQLQGQQDEVVAAREALDAAEKDVAAAEAVLEDARGVLATYQDEVAVYASAIYRDGGALTPLMVLLSGGDPGDVVTALAYLEAVDEHAAEVIGAAEEKRQAALAEQRRAEAAFREAQAQADEVAQQVEELEAQATEVTEELDEALEVVDRQLAQLQEEQLTVNEQTALNWRNYLNELTASGVVPPAAAELRDPESGVPDGLVPVASDAGGAQRGAAQLPRQPSSLLVLPAETLAAVSAAMEELDLPYAPGTSGPESWDCGSLVRSVYADAGISLPGTQGELFAVTTPVERADVLPGDLVFLGTPETGLGHVGIALDTKTMLAADARAGAVVVRNMPTDEILGIGRPSLEQRAAVPAPGPTGSALSVECGNAVYPPTYDGVREWGGYPNGLIPPSAMCEMGVNGHRLRCDAAAAYRAMSSAFASSFGTPICITDSYRTYEAQVRLYGQKPALAAVPGTSNHGWGLAVDLCGGIQSFGTPQYAWMVANAGRFGFIHPTWADPGNGREEPWHWEFAGT